MLALAGGLEPPRLVVGALGGAFGAPGPEVSCPRGVRAAGLRFGAMLVMAVGTSGGAARVSCTCEWRARDKCVRAQRSVVADLLERSEQEAATEWRMCLV